MIDAVVEQLMLTIVCESGTGARGLQGPEELQRTVL
jgi:hypothetical protein